MSDRPELVVIGAGPAGISAASVASRSGVNTLIVDEAPQAGGQVYRPLPSSFAVTDQVKLGPDHAIGDRLRAELAQSPARKAFQHRVWRIGPGFTVEALGPDGLQEWTPRKVIAATGAHERVVPFPGWTEPGVIGLAAATILLKSQRALPGRSVVVAGCGPLLAAVAVAIVKAGGKVAAIVDLASPADWLASLPAMARRPDLLARGLGWVAQIRRAGIPLLFRHTVAAVESSDRGLSAVTVQPVDASGRPRAGAARRTFAADALAVGHGLVPSTEISRVLRAKHAFRSDRGGWIVECDEGCRTSVPGLYACGDGAGIAGAVPAAIQGRIAGLTAALDLGKVDRAAYDTELAALRGRLRRAERFGIAMARLMAPRPALFAAIGAETVVCRCEDVTRGEIDDAISTGAVDLNQIKAWTRGGMGPCQGRICGEAIGSLAAARWGSREQAGLWTGRLPLRPIPLGELIGEYRYEDLAWLGNKAQFDDQGQPLANVEPKR